MTIKNILFDLDGTLLDTNELIIQSFQYTYKTHLKKDVPKEEIIKSFGEILKVTLDREFKDLSDVALKTYRDFQFSRFDDYITMHQGVKEGLKRLYDDGYHLGVVTSRLNESAKRGLDLFHLTDYFDVIIGADDTTIHKPDPTPALLALEKIGGQVEESMIVGDSPYDILCGKNAGMISVAVGWSALPRDMYMKHDPDHVVESMEELIDIIKSL
ncbi:pyrophosphatase PpaX [Inediibacterium massiliense]|uniref:pyrophosphatase PpaX n=1 Tax=Inediibacterium massiliense TaxID=1658111 RepID=UPI0006B44ECF|nr:pyrophosphatase PpaX [Inediibacterium massiliense]